jgi:hypothetical protein
MAYEAGRRVGFGVSALLLGFVTFLSLLGAEKAILAIVWRLFLSRNGRGSGCSGGNGDVPFVRCTSSVECYLQEESGMKPVDPAEISALLDGELTAERAEQVRCAIAEDNQLRLVF